MDEREDVGIGLAGATVMALVFEAIGVMVVMIGVAIWHHLSGGR